jgi:two-component system, NtrC family, response regulator AlgB
MRRGAFDFIPKPFTPDQIRAVLAKVAKAHALERRVQALESDLASGLPPVDLESAEPSMAALEIAFKAAETDANILILGPSGTGKSVLAREIHKRSARREEAFVTVNCPSLSRELFESELFGHAKGSFTGAVAETSGKVAAADGGTLFLDEIGEMPLEIQPKLLRLLQEREYERVGEARPRKGERACHRRHEPRPGGRGEGGPLPRGPLLPAQRDRGHASRPARPAGRPEAPCRGCAAVFRLAHGQGRRSPSRRLSVLTAFATYPWPGNLRELRNVIERAVILAPGKTRSSSRTCRRVLGRAPARDRRGRPRHARRARGRAHPPDPGLLAQPGRGGPHARDRSGDPLPQAEQAGPPLIGAFRACYAPAFSSGCFPCSW